MPCGLAMPDIIVKKTSFGTSYKCMHAVAGFG